jgi:putative ABC transport system permease protein
MKLIDIFAMASSNMLRSKLRTILTIIAIFIGSFTITLTVGISSGISGYIDKQLGNIGAEDILFIQAKIENPLESSDGLTKYDPEAKGNVNMTSSMEAYVIGPDDIEKIKQQDGISNVKPILGVSPKYIYGPNEQKYEVSITESIEGSNIDLVAGHTINMGKNEILLPIKFVEPLGFSSAENAIGKTVTFGINDGIKPEIVTISATIAGVQQESIISSATGVLASPLLIDKMYSTQTDGLPDSVTNQYVGATAKFDKNISEDELAKIKESLSKKGYDAMTIKDQIGIIKQIIDAITYVLIFFSAIALLAASFGIINTLFMAVQERTKEIGLMKAMGMSKGKIFMLFSIEAILIGFWGSFLGVLVAMGVGQIVNPIASHSFLKDLPGFELTVFPPLDVSLVILLIATIAFLAGTLPAKRAAKLDPIDALRYE